MELLINELTKAGGDARAAGGEGVRRRQCPARARSCRRSASATPSSRRATCSVEQIPLRASDLLDDFPRKVYFFPKTGKVHGQALAHARQRYRARARARLRRQIRARPRAARSSVCETQISMTKRRKRIRVVDRRRFGADPQAADRNHQRHSRTWKWSAPRPIRSPHAR